MKRAFTLVELVLVVTVMAIITSLVMLSVRGHLENARLEATIDRIKALDARIRTSARRLRARHTLLIDAEAGLLRDLNDDVPSRRAHVSGGIEVDQLRAASYAGSLRKLRVGISPEGLGDSYALRLRTATGQKTWLVVLGMSGQCVRLEEDRDVEALFAR